MMNLVYLGPHGLKEERMTKRDVRSQNESVLEVKHLTKRYHIRGEGDFLALNNVNFTLRSGQIIGLVGQSGSGKSTIAKILTQLETATSGEILLNGNPIPRSGRALRKYRQTLRMVFQDPFASLNPYHTIRHHIERPLLLDHVVPTDQVDGEVRRLLLRVRLDPDAVIDRRPHELSGGQRQRIAIARALASRPKLLIADEPVSMLDVSLRLGVLNLLADLQKEENLGVLYITHDLATARYFSQELIVLNQGQIVERGPSDDVILHPKQEYTRKLRDASPNPKKFFEQFLDDAQESLTSVKDK